MGLQAYVASCTGSKPPKSNGFPKKLVAIVKPEQVPEQLNSLFGTQTEWRPTSSTIVPTKSKNKKLFETEAEAMEVAHTMRALLDTGSNSQGSTSQDQKTTIDAKNKNAQNKKKKNPQKKKKKKKKKKK